MSNLDRLLGDDSDDDDDSTKKSEKKPPQRTSNWMLGTDYVISDTASCTQPRRTRNIHEEDVEMKKYTSDGEAESWSTKYNEEQPEQVLFMKKKKKRRKRRKSWKKRKDTPSNRSPVGGDILVPEPKGKASGVLFTKKKKKRRKRKKSSKKSKRKVPPNSRKPDKDKPDFPEEKNANENTFQEDIILERWQRPSWRENDIVNIEETKRWETQKVEKVEVPQRVFKGVFEERPCEFVMRKSTISFVGERILYCDVDEFAKIKITSGGDTEMKSFNLVLETGEKYKLCVDSSIETEFKRTFIEFMNLCQSEEDDDDDEDDDIRRERTLVTSENFQMDFKFLMETRQIVLLEQTILFQFNEIRKIIESGGNFTNTKFEQIYTHFEKLQGMIKKPSFTLHKEAHFRNVFNHVKAVVSFMKDVEMFLFHKFFRFQSTLINFRKNEQLRKEKMMSCDKNDYETFVRLARAQVETLGDYFTLKDQVTSSKELKKLREVFKLRIVDLPRAMIGKYQEEMMRVEKYDQIFNKFETVFNKVVNQVKSGNFASNSQKKFVLRNMYREITSSDSSQHVHIFVKTTLEKAKMYLNFEVLDQYLIFHRDRYKDIERMDKLRKECVKNIREGYFGATNYKKWFDSKVEKWITYQRNYTAKLSDFMKSQQIHLPEIPVSHNPEILALFPNIKKKFNRLRTVAESCKKYYEILPKGDKRLGSYFGEVEFSTLKPNGIGKYFRDHLVFVGLSENGKQHTGVWFSEDGEISFYQNEEDKVRAEWSNEKLRKDVFDKIGIHLNLDDPHLFKIPYNEIEILKDEQGRDVVIGKGGKFQIFSKSLVLGFGDVKKCLLHGSFVAMKVISLNDDVKKYHQTIKKEVELVKSLMVYPGVVKTLGFSKLDKINIGVIMEYLDGGSLDTIRNEVITNFEKWMICKKVLNCINFLHSRDLIHCDIKPSNFLISKDKKTLKISDFGMSKFRDSKTTQSVGGIPGTPRYSAPELFIKSQSKTEVVKCTHKSDVYSAGMTCYQIISGKIPFVEIKNEFAVVVQIMQGRKPALPPNTPKEFEKLLDMSLEMDPNARATTRQLLNFMEQNEEEFFQYNKPPMDINKIACLNVESLTIGPISQQIDPVIIAETGNTYERTEIEKWLSEHDTDPLTNLILKSKILTPNRSIRNLIDELKRMKKVGELSKNMKEGRGNVGSPVRYPE